MKGRYHVAIDVGAGSGRMFAGYLEDGLLKLEEIHRFETGDMIYRGQYVRNVYRWYEEMLTGLKKFTQQYGGALESLACDCMGEDMVLLDSFGEILWLPPSYRNVSLDPRILQIEAERMGNYEIFKRCGNQSVNNDTLRQLIGLSISAPQLLQSARGMLFLGDLFHYLFCGARSVGYSLANYGKLFNQSTQTWDSEIFRAFHIPDALKMPVARFGEKLGRVYAEICAEVGLNCPPYVLSAGIHDSACAAFCIPDASEDWAFISSGSWSVVGMQTEHPILNEAAWRLNCSNSGMPMNANMFKKLVGGMWIIQRCQKEWKEYSFDAIVARAGGVEENHFYLDPDAPQFYNPRDMCAAISSDIFARYGQHIPPDDVGGIARICFESLALKYRYTLERLQRIANRRIKRICILGGGSRNALLNQLSANACQVPVYAGIFEASVTGNILVQMIGCGELRDAAQARQVLRKTFSLRTYQPQSSQLWEEKYADYIRLLHLQSR